MLNTAMNLKGKKIACFLALPHHTRFFIPLLEEVKRQGGEMMFIVTLSEYPYELDLAKKRFPFRFFSDYLTAGVKAKVDAAVGALLDEWAKVCFKWDGFSRWPLFKQGWFFESVIEEYFCVERFLEVEKPDMFIAHHECNRWGQTIGHLCHKMSVPFVTFQEGDYHGEYIGFLVHTHYSNADLLWGNRTRNVLKEYKCSMDKISIIGNTHIESAVKTYSAPHIVTEIKKELRIPDGKKVIVFLLDIKYAGIARKDPWEELLKGLDRLDKEAVLIFKWHPSIMKNSFNTIKEIFRELFPSAILLDTYEAYKLLAIADYCITMGKTTLAIEALAFGRPLFSFPSIDTLEDYYTGIGVAQTVYPPGNWQNLFHTMRHGLPESIQESVAKYLEEYFYRLDGKTLERAVERMSYILNVHNSRKKIIPQKRSEFVTGRISFILPTGGDTEALLATLTSLSQNVAYPDWEIVLVVNDAAAHGIVAGLSGDIRVVEVQSDALGTLYNRGKEASSGEYLVFIRPGIVFFKGEGLVEGMSEGIAGIMIRNPDMTPYCSGIGYDFNSTPYFIKEESTPNAEHPTPNAYREAAGGGFLAMKRMVFEPIGGFDEELANHLIEPDLCLKGKELDVPVRYLPGCLGFNYVETFFMNDASDEQWRKRLKFFAKWVGKLPRDGDFLSFAGDVLKV